MADSTTMIYIFMGVMYVIMFIVVGTFLVFRKRRNDSRDQTENEGQESTNLRQHNLQDQSDDQQLTRRKGRDLEHMKKAAQDLEEALDPCEEKQDNGDGETVDAKCNEEHFDKSDNEKKED